MAGIIRLGYNVADQVAQPRTPLTSKSSTGIQEVGTGSQYDSLDSMEKKLIWNHVQLDPRPEKETPRGKTRGETRRHSTGITT